MKVQLGAKSIMFPVSVVLVVSGPPEKPNIITIAWIGMVCSLPPIVAISVKKSCYSFDLIRKTKEFSINVPPAKYYKEVDFCGMVSGMMRDKFKDTKFTPIKSRRISPPIIEECPFNIECKLRKELEVADRGVFFGEIVETHIDSDKVIDHFNNKIDIAKVDPIVYCAGVREYWSLGEKLGESFRPGGEILSKVSG